MLTEGEPIRRISVRNLMAFVLVSAIALAALRNANDWSAGTMLSVALVAFGTAILGAIFLRRRERARWTGFALFSGIYLALTFWPSLSDTFRAKLATGHLIREMYKSKFQTPLLPKIKVTEINMTSGVTKSSWVTPTKPSYEHFQSVGHSLFALVAGLLGSAVAVWFHARQTRVDAAAG
jgi:hypothetical protein